MPRIDPIQRSFSAGELTELMHARSDSDIYKEGVVQLKDFMTTDLGPVYKRHGTVNDISNRGEGFVVQFDSTNACAVRFSKPGAFGTIEIVKLTDTSAAQTFGDPVSYHPWSDSDAKETYGIQDPTGLVVYFLHPGYPIQKIVWTDPTDPFTFTMSAPTITDTPWGAGNYPSVGTFHQGRFFVAASDTNPATIWGSKSNDYEDFTTGPLAADSLDFTLSANGRIMWLVSDKFTLLTGTVNSEHTVVSDGGVLIPGDIFAERQSAYGSIKQYPIVAEDKVLFVTADQKHVRSIVYNERNGGYISDDLTYFVDIPTNHKILKVVFQRRPFSLLWAYLDDGHLLCTTFKKESNFFGFGHHSIADCVTSDIITWESDGVSSIGIKLVIDGVVGDISGIISYSEIKEGVFLDHSITAAYVTDDTIINLGYLEGKTVQLLVNGATHKDLVVSGGQVVLDYNTTGDVTVGLAYNSILETLPIEEITQSGSTLGWSKRWNKIFVKLLNSAIPKINGKRPPIRDYDTPLDEIQPLETGNIKVANLGYDEDGKILIEQELPYPCIIVGIFGELTNSKL